MFQVENLFISIVPVDLIENAIGKGILAISQLTLDSQLCFGSWVGILGLLGLGNCMAPVPQQGTLAGSVRSTSPSRPNLFEDFGCRSLFKDVQTMKCKL